MPIENANQLNTYDTNKTSIDYDIFCNFLEDACGITLGKNKAYLVNSRLKAIMDEYGFKTLAEIVKEAKSGTNNRIRVQIIDAMTTNETSWFRDIYPFDYLKDTILPEFARTAKHTPRIWSAACSYGHEPYSISISIQEYLERNPGLFKTGIDILGTDISKDALDKARKAEYDDLGLARGLSAERKQRYFKKSVHGMQVNDPVKNRVKFFELNLLKNYSLLGQFDVVFCRNVLIYFSNENKSEILKKIGGVMQPKGYLFLGASEPIINYSGEFEMLHCPRGVVYQKKV